MNLVLHPINTHQRAGMPRFNNLEKHGLADTIIDKVKGVLDKGEAAYNKFNETQAAIARANAAYDEAYHDPNYGTSQPIPISPARRDTYMLYGSLVVVVIAAFAAKKYVFDK